VHHHIYNTDTGTLTDIITEQVKISGLPDLPEGIVSEGIDIIVRVRNSPQIN